MCNVQVPNLTVPCHTWTVCLLFFGKRSEHPAPSVVSFDVSLAWLQWVLAWRGQSWSLGSSGVKMGRQTCRVGYTAHPMLIGAPVTCLA